MTYDKSTTIPLDDCAMTISVGRDGTWLNFSAANGKHASIRVESLAENSVHIIGAALLGWCEDRVVQADQIRKDNGQFGVGA